MIWYLLFLMFFPKIIFRKEILPEITAVAITMFTIDYDIPKNTKEEALNEVAFFVDDHYIEMHKEDYEYVYHLYDEDYYIVTSGTYDDTSVSILDALSDVLFELYDDGVINSLDTEWMVYSELMDSTDSDYGYLDE